jgi:hypothetical protein
VESKCGAADVACAERAVVGTGVWAKSVDADATLKNATAAA